MVSRLLAPISILALAVLCVLSAPKADAAIVAAGIAADRISTISYGKERPFVLGHDESAWKWNRRGHFVLSGQ